MEAFIKAIEHTISQEPTPAKPAEVQPPIEATAPVPGVTGTAPVVGDNTVAQSQPSDDLRFDSAAPQSKEEAVARKLELVFSEFPDPKDCVSYEVFNKYLNPGAPLSSINPVRAEKILLSPKAFLRSVEQWVKRGRK